MRRLTNYIARCPVAEAKIHQESPEDDVLYDAEHSEPLPFQKWKALPTERTITRNFEVFDPLDFLAQVTQHIPDKNQHLSRYYGWYSNVSRGKRAKGKGKQYRETYVRPASEAHKRWAMLIKQVYEVDPFECPECGGEMKVIAFIRDPVVIYKILDHLDLLESSGKDPPGDPPGSPLRYEPVFDDLPWGDDPFHVC